MMLITSSLFVLIVVCGFSNFETKLTAFVETMSRHFFTLFGYISTYAIYSCILNGWTSSKLSLSHRLSFAWTEISLSRVVLKNPF